MSADIAQVARILCGRTPSGFCRNVGGSLGCPVGRGERRVDECRASIDQLILAGHWAVAEEIVEQIESEAEE